MQQDVQLRREADVHLRRGALFMAVAGAAFIGYGVVFFIRDLVGGGFELGVDTLNGVTRAELAAFSPASVHYISHLHVATAAFIISTGIAVTGLAWHGVRQGQLWAWVTAVGAAVLGLVLALPMHYMDLFSHNWVTHLGPVYLATLVFVAGAVLALRGLRASTRIP